MTDAKRSHEKRPETKLRLQMFRVLCAICATAVLALAAMRLQASEPDPEQTPHVDFNRDIRPILAQHCWSCHGPDEQTRQADLRLDRRDSAVAAQAIVPGDPAASELIDRIESDDESRQMPPPEAKKPLSDRQRKLLRAWIKQGAGLAAVCGANGDEPKNSKPSFETRRRRCVSSAVSGRLPQSPI